MDIHGYPWVTHGCPRILNPWISMDIHGYPCISMDINGNPWISVLVLHPGSEDITLSFFKETVTKNSFFSRGITKTSPYAVLGEWCRQKHTVKATTNETFAFRCGMVPVFEERPFQPPLDPAELPEHPKPLPEPSQSSSNAHARVLPDAFPQMPSLSCLLADACSQMPRPRCFLPDASSQITKNTV